MTSPAQPAPGGPSSTPVPRDAPAEVRAAAARPVAPALARPHRSIGLLIGAIAGFIVVGLAILLVAAYLYLLFGPTLLLIGGIMALIPLAIVLLGAHWIDRWEPEPFGVRLFAFLWGAGTSIVIALTVDSAAQIVIRANGGATGATELAQAIVQAPVVEEGAKGLGVLLIFLVANKYFDGPVDGIAYAAIVAAGFAFSENIQYFGLAIAQSHGVGEIAYVFFMRGVLSPFAHAMFTSMTGLLIGIAAQRGGRWRGVLFALIGLVPAILLHGFWNASLSFVSNFLGYYLLVQVPLFVIAIVMVVVLRDREMRLVRERLEDYAAAGWFHAGEVASLATPAGRRSARAWARGHGIGRVMRAYIRDATRLALTRHRIIVGRDRASAQIDETALLTRIVAERARIGAAIAAAGPTPTV